MIAMIDDMDTDNCTNNGQTTNCDCNSYFND